MRMPAITLEPAGGYSKKSFLWIAAAVVLIGIVGAWFLFFRTPPIAEVDLPAGSRQGNVGYSRIFNASDCRTCGDPGYTPAGPFGRDTAGRGPFIVSALSK